MSSLKIFTCKGTLRQVFIRVYRLGIQSVMFVFSTKLCELLPLYLLSSSPPPSPLPCLNKIYSVQVQYTERGGRVNQREGYRGNSSQSWVENTNITGCTSYLCTLINTCRKVPLQVRLCIAFFQPNLSTL